MAAGDSDDKGNGGGAGNDNSGADNGGAGNDNGGSSNDNGGGLGGGGGGLSGGIGDSMGGGIGDSMGGGIGDSMANSSIGGSSSTGSGGNGDGGGFGKGGSSFGLDVDTGWSGWGGDESPKDSGSTVGNMLGSLSNWASDTWGSFSNWVSGAEDTAGFSPMGGPQSYGMSKQTFDQTIGKRRHESRSLGQRMKREVDYFTEAPLDYVSDLLDNPLVAGAALLSGLGTTAFGVKVADTVTDLYQRETSPLKAMQTMAGDVVSLTPVGQALGALQPMTRGAIKEGPVGAVKGMAGMIGGKFGADIGGELATAVTDNPYVGAAITASVAGTAAVGAKRGLETATAAPGTAQPSRAPRDSDRDSRESPLIASGRRAVEAQESLMQPAQADLYAQTVKQLPWYGLGGPLQQQQLPYYGV